MISLAIHGAAGRMGRRLIDLGAQDPDLQLTAALESSQHPQLGQDAGAIAGCGELGLPLSASWSEPPQAVIDFSVPAGAESITQICRDQKTPLVMATTGLSDQQKQALTDASQEIPIVWAPNMSLAVNLVMKLSSIAGETLKGTTGGVDVEILERHHRFKEDAPSGTALRFGEIIADAMGLSKHTHGREGITGKRPAEEIGYHALRVSDDPGQHTIVFGMMGELIELSVKASNRDCYALGALAAAKFVAGKAPGIYGMDDVLGL